MDIKIKKLNGSDIAKFIELISVFEDTFEMKNFVIPPEDHLRNLLADHKFMVFVALDEDHKVIGGLTAYTLIQYYSLKPLVYVYDLAVTRNSQRKGIGLKLMREIIRYCTEAGMEEVFVQADKVDQHALSFYRKINPTAEEDVSHFYFSLQQDT